MNTEREIKCYGMTAAEVREEYGNSITAKVAGPEMVVMSIMSDCQELLAIAGEQDSTREQVRQMLNIGKLLLSDIMRKEQSSGNSFLEAAVKYCKARGDCADFRGLFRVFRESKGVVDSVWNALESLYGSTVANMLQEIHSATTGE